MSGTITFYYFSDVMLFLFVGVLSSFSFLWALISFRACIVFILVFRISFLKFCIFEAARNTS